MSGRNRGGRGRGDRGGYGSGGQGGDRGRGEVFGFGGGPRGRGGGPSIRGGGLGGRDPVEVHSNPDGSIPPPNAQVTKTEDAIQEALSSGGGLGLGSLQIGPQFPRRPGYGTKGQKVILWANYFQMMPSPALVLYRYNVAVQPDAKGKKLNQLFRLLLGLPEYAEFRDGIVTDFKSTLISRERLNPDTAELEFSYRAEGEDVSLPNAQRYRLRVEETGTLSVSDLIDYLNSTNLSTTYNDQLPIVQALNIFLGNYSKSNSAIATIGSSRSFSISNASRTDLGAGLLALRGFFSSVRLATCRILVNVNVSHAGFYEPLDLHLLIRKWSTSNGFNVKKLQLFLKRVRVRTTHLTDKKNKAGVAIPRIKTIFGLADKGDGRGLDHPPRVRAFGANSREVEFFLVDSTGAPSSSSAGPATGTGGGKKKGKGPKGGNSGGNPGQSASQAGEYISVYDFFRTRYGRLKDSPTMPVVNVGNKENPSYLPAEVCLVIAGQNSPKLDSTQTDLMTTFGCRPPWQNANMIVREGLETVGLLPTINPHLERFNISMATDLITVPGRILVEPKIKYANKAAIVRNGSWNMADIQFNSGAILRTWTWLVINTRDNRNSFDEAQIEPMVNGFRRTLQDVGITVAQPLRGRTIYVENVDNENVIEATMNGAPRGPGGQPTLILIMLPIKNKPLYNRIKHIGDVKIGVHTVCVVGSKFNKDREAKGQTQYLANVALKVNLKLGGTNQKIDGTKLGIINEDKTMVVGVDVTHPAAGSASNAPSVAGMVASIDKWLGQWPADLRIQESRKEMVSELDSMLKSRLQLWKTLGKHPALPENLLVYRDGVSEGQYATVLDVELPLLRKACAELYPPADTKKGLPRISIIVVGKRHHTRFYPTSLTDADGKNGSPKNGTVVDRGVTEARNWDFFLQAHAAIIGTARPAHYYVVLDEIFAKRKVPPPLANTADVVEDLTHNMCYLYGRATKAVSICPPAYYADKVCDRARCYLTGLFDGQTSAQSEAGDAATADVLIHPNLRNTMFYI